MDVRLPDGTIIRNVPEGTTRAQLTARLKRNGYDVSSLLDEEEERTFGGYAKEAFKGLIPGAVSGIETAIAGAASVLPEEAEQAVRRKVSEVAEPIRETFAPAPGYEDTVVRELSEAVGSTAPFIGAGLLGKLAATGLAAATGAGQARQRAEQEDVTEGERAAATALGIGPGLIEAVPPLRILRRFGFGKEAIDEVAGLAPSLRRIAAAGGEEALQEASSQVLQNLIAKGVYKPEEEVFGGVTEAAGLGGGAGAIIGAIAELALGRRLRGTEPPPEEQEEGITEEPTPPVTPATRVEAAQRARIAPSEQMELPLDTEAVQIPMFGEEEAAAPTPSLYRPAEDALSDLKPRSRAYKEEARSLGLKLDRKGNVKPNQFVFEQPETEVPITQGRFEFEVPQEQPDLPMYVPPTEGQMDMFGTPMPRGGEMPTVPTAAEMPVVEEVPEEQYALNLPGIPMERLTPRDRVLRAMAITEDKKIIPNLQFATELRPMELLKTLGDLKKENAIKFNKQTNEWELTPEGAERVRTPRKKIGSARLGRRADVSVPPSGTPPPPTAGVGEPRVAGVGAPPAQSDVGEEAGQPPLDRMAIIRRAQEKRVAQQAVGQVADRRSTLRTQAIDAFDTDKINEAAYNEINTELKKPVPNFARVSSLLEGTAKPKREREIGLDLERANTFKAQPRIAKETKQFLTKNKGDRDALTQIADLMLQTAPRASEAVDYAQDYLDPSGAIKETIKSKPGVNARRMAKMLGPQLYGDPSDMGVVTIKEILQNSFDSIKGMIDNGELTKGKIDIDVDPDNRIIEMTDNGRGMTPQLLGTKFLEIAGTGKDAKTPSGGFGIAKMLFLYGNKGIRVTTMRDGKVAEMLTDGEQLFDALENPELAPNILVRAPTEEDLQKFPDGHGTNIALTIPENFNDPTTGEVKDIRMVQYEGSVKPLMKSPLFADIDVSFRNKRYGEYRDPIPIGSSFPYNNYTQFTNVKFPWGTARVYVAPSEETYGDNLHVLSNGLYQFSQKVSKDPLDIWSNPVPFQFYVDIKPTVKPEDPGYPFTFNRKDFTEQAKKDYGKIMSYINALYAYQDISNSASSFGSIQYFDGPNKLSAPIEVKPTVPPATTTFAGIQQGDNVTVEDGKLFVRGKELPELTPDQLRAGIPKADQLKVDPKLIDSNRVMMHDNLKLAASDQTFSDYMRSEYGKAFDTFMYEIGDVFKDLRNEVVDVIGYDDLANEAVGLSFDKEYRGVSIRVPFSGSFINPFSTRSVNPLEAAYGTFGTMIHELAHHKVRSHNADFPAEMQFIEYKLQAANKLKFDAYQNRLINAFNKYQDIFENGWRLVNESGSLEARGDHFKDGSREDASRTADEGVPSGKRGPSGARPAGERVQPPAEQGRAVAGEGRAAAERRPADEGTAGLAAKATAERTSEPLKQPKINATFVRSVGSSQNRLPEPTARIKEGARTAASMIPRWLRRGVFSFESTHQLADMYRPYTDKLDELWDLQNRDGAALRLKTDKIHDNLKKWHKVMDKFPPAVRERIYNLFLDTTVDQIEVLDSAADPVLRDNAAVKNMKVVMKPNTEHSLYKQFSQLPQPVRDLYRDLRLAYLEDANEMEQLLSQYITPSEWQKLQMEFNKKRLAVYLPLFRSGEYKLVYTDKDGETVSRQFETSEEREKAFREVRSSGIPESKIVRKMASEFAASDIPPAGFYGKVVAKLRENDVDEKTIAKLFDLYMDYMPATSVLQLRRKRKKTPGYESDVLRAYASVGGAYARRLVNMRFMPQINKAFEDLRADLGQGSFWVSYKDSKGRTVRNGYDTDELRRMAVRQAIEDGADRNSVKYFSLSDEEAADIEDIVQGQIDFFNNPKLDNYASKAAYFSFTMYMGGNISSAIIDLTHIPMVVYSLLGSKYGFGRAAASMQRAHRYYMNPKKKLPSEIAELPSVMKRATEDGILGEQRIMDLAEFNNRFGDFGSKALEVKARVDRAMGSIFAMSDRYNRGLTFISAYELAKNQLQKKGLKGDELLEAAYTDAKRAVYDSYGSSFPKAGPSIMQNGLARLALTFKRFALNRMWLLFKALDQATRGESKEVKNIARAQLLGFYGMAYVFSGAQGLPFMGAFQLLASIFNGMFGDDDELYDIQDATRQAVGMFNYRGPINYLLGVDIASRSGWDQMLWRDDPRRIAEVGPATYAMEQLLGPAFSYAVNAPRAFEHFSEGRFSQGMETLTPRVIANIFKSFRYGTDGALTKDNIPVVDDISKYNQFMQLLGFAPTEVSEAYQQAGVAKKFEREINDRRDGLIRRAMMAIVSEDDEGRVDALKEIMKFNEKHPGKPITDESISRSVTNHYIKLNQSVNGVRVDPKLAQEIYDRLGYDTEDTLDESTLEEQEDLATDLLYE